MSAWTLLKVKAGRNLKDVSPLGPTFTPEKSNKQKALIHDKVKLRSAENGFFDVDFLLIYICVCRFLFAQALNNMRMDTQKFSFSQLISVFSLVYRGI